MLTARSDQATNCKKLATWETKLSQRSARCAMHAWCVRGGVGALVLAFSMAMPSGFRSGLGVSTCCSGGPLMQGGGAPTLMFTPDASTNIAQAVWTLWPPRLGPDCGCCAGVLFDDFRSCFGALLVHMALGTLVSMLSLSAPTGCLNLAITLHSFAVRVAPIGQRAQ